VPLYASGEEVNAAALDDTEGDRETDGVRPSCFCCKRRSNGEARRSISELVSGLLRFLDGIRFRVKIFLDLTDVNSLSYFRIKAPTSPAALGSLG
jgi:hypothetical protein